MRSIVPVLSVFQIAMSTACSTPTDAGERAMSSAAGVLDSPGLPCADLRA